jgi:hypothetical protein
VHEVVLRAWHLPNPEQTGRAVRLGGYLVREVAREQPDMA